MKRAGMSTALLAVLVAASTVACAPTRTASSSAAASAAVALTTPDGAKRLLSTLAHDSLQGRYTGTEHAMKAARIIAAKMAEVGLEPLGDDGFLQRVPLYVAGPSAPGRLPRPMLAASFAALDTVPAERRLPGANVVGMLRGSDPALRDEYVIVGAHYDHVGMNPAAAVDGDSIFNGADDDASGVVAMLESARQLKEGGAPRRSVIFVAFTGEENGMTGTRHYIASPARPLAQTIADIQIEMIGRPDSLAGGAGKGWLTGYERSTMGEMLVAAGVPVIADPRPAQNFFSRSDNFPFAKLGIPAHTISSFGGHTDYHRPSDETETIDFAHMSAVINATARAVRVIADGARPEWKAGGKPN
ncbi:MAG TPA: M20/M25/M40 family metallo-hydrolase [Gemmatimonadaceae bacterium]|nr:M20/M25/M40 family metallo-hydrolase [Gemmatimonadaceae bacterium]